MRGKAKAVADAKRLDWLEQEAPRIEIGTRWAELAFYIGSEYYIARGRSLREAIDQGINYTETHG